MTFDTKYFLKSHHIYISLSMFAIKDALLVQCESVLQMLSANKMPMQNSIILDTRVYN